MREIVQRWEPPYTLLYELEASRHSEWQDGRYQSEWMDFDTLENLLIEGWDFFEQDGRHNIWIASADPSFQIIYDQHEILYVYGEGDDLLAEFVERGFSTLAPKIPEPHMHMYHREFDASFDALMASQDWIFSPIPD